MYKLKVLLTVSALGLVGCETMLPHVKVSDSFAERVGMAGTMIEQCEVVGVFPPGTTQQYVDTASALDAATVIDRNHMRIGADRVRALLRADTDYESECALSTEGLASTISEMQRLTQQGLAARGMAFAYTPTPMPVFTPTPMPGPAGQPTYGLPQSDTTHIYRNGSLTSCTTTSSGVVVCN